MPDIIDRIIVGDFNLYCNLEDRNRDGANYPTMLMFNDAISTLGQIELPLKGQRFTWSNKQHPLLLEHLDWFFTSVSWTISYPNTSVSTLTMETSDHVPCLISVSTPQYSHFLSFVIVLEECYFQIVFADR
jgi:endonuclease/exonuclease/phosphatase family metal-dependent hydrolase